MAPQKRQKTNTTIVLTEVVTCSGHIAKELWKTNGVGNVTADIPTLPEVAVVVDLAAGLEENLTKATH